MSDVIVQSQWKPMDVYKNRLRYRLNPELKDRIKTICTILKQDGSIVTLIPYPLPSTKHPIFTPKNMPDGSTAILRRSLGRSGFLRAVYVVYPNGDVHKCDKSGLELTQPLGHIDEVIEDLTNIHK